MNRLWWLFLLAGCTRVPEVLFQCEADGGCDKGFQCATLDAGRYCVPEVDAGEVEPRDAGQPDAGSDDAGFVDAGSDDAGSEDAGSDDAGSPDAGSVDGGSSDAGSIDGGSVDAGSIDAGVLDAGSADAGSVDGGAADAGRLDAGLQCPTISPCRGCGVIDAGAGCPVLTCGCSVGLTCSPASTCVMPQLCTGAWCYEQPLPQGGHLFAAWASQTRPTVVGQPAALWGGERGVVFEWDGLNTVASQLPSAQGTIVGLTQQGQDFLAITNIATVFRRTGPGTWTPVYGAPNFIVPTVGVANPCPVFAHTSLGDFLACTSGNSMLVLKVGATQFDSELVQGSSNRPRALGELAGRLFLSVSGAASSIHVRDGGTWLAVGADPLKVVVGFASDAMNSYITFEDGGVASTSRLAPSFAMAAPVTGLTGPFVASAQVGTATALAGRGLVILNAGLASTLVDPTSLHERSWFAVAALPEGFLTVGAFGATAFFPTTGTPVLASSPFAARPTDVCGTSTGGSVFLTHSAAAGDPRLTRNNDVLSLKEADAFRGVAFRGVDGGWSAFPDTRTAAAGWRPSLDQCWVDRGDKLHLASPFGFARFGSSGQERFDDFPYSRWNLLAPAAPAPALTGFWAEDTNLLISAENCLIGNRGVGAFDVLLGGAMPSQCAPFALGTEALCAGANDDRLIRTTTGSGLAYFVLNEPPTGFEQRHALFGNPVTNTFFLLQQSPAQGLLRLSKRPPCSTCTFTQLYQGPVPANAMVGNLWADVGEGLYWLRYTEAQGAMPVPRTSAVSIEWLKPDGGTGASNLPSWVYDERAGTLPFNIWGNATHMFVQTNRGLVSAVRP